MTFFFIFAGLVTIGIIDVVLQNLAIRSAHPQKTGLAGILFFGRG